MTLAETYDSLNDAFQGHHAKLHSCQIVVLFIILMLAGCSQKRGIEAFDGPKFDAILCKPLIGVWEDRNHLWFELFGNGTGEGYNQQPMIWSCDGTTFYIKEPNEEGWDDHPGNKFQYILKGDKLILDNEFYSVKEFSKK